MTDVYLYQGQASPGDVRLTDPTQLSFTSVAAQAVLTCTGALASASEITRGTSVTISCSCAVSASPERVSQGTIVELASAGLAGAATLVLGPSSVIECAAMVLAQVTLFGEVSISISCAVEARAGLLSERPVPSHAHVGAVLWIRDHAEQRRQEERDRNTVLHTANAVVVLGGFRSGASAYTVAPMKNALRIRMLPGGRLELIMPRQATTASARVSKRDEALQSLLGMEELVELR